MMMPLLFVMLWSQTKPLCESFDHYDDLIIFQVGINLILICLIWRVESWSRHIEYCLCGNVFSTI